MHHAVSIRKTNSLFMANTSDFTSRFMFKVAVNYFSGGLTAGGMPVT